MNLKLGTRGSDLALTQTQLVVDALTNAYPELAIEIIPIKTEGDRKQDTPLATTNDKKNWVYDLEVALQKHEIDLALHSGKDVPSNTELDTALLPVLHRADPRDVLIGQINGGSGKRLTFSEIPEGGKVGTASLRRQAQLLRLRPDLEIVDHRGNVPTRIKKLDSGGDVSAIVLAQAGLNRLQMDNLSFEPFSTTDLVPALNQGTLIAQFLKQRTDVAELLSAVVHPETKASWEAERAVADLIEADCSSAVGIYAEVSDHELHLISRVLSPDGTTCLEKSSSGPISSAREIGTAVGQQLIRGGAQKIIEDARSWGVQS